VTAARVFEGMFTRARVLMYTFQITFAAPVRKWNVFFMKKLTKSQQNTPQLQFNGKCDKVIEPYKGVGFHN